MISRLTHTGYSIITAANITIRYTKDDYSLEMILIQQRLKDLKDRSQPLQKITSL